MDDRRTQTAWLRHQPRDAVSTTPENGEPRLAEARQGHTCEQPQPQRVQAHETRSGGSEPDSGAVERAVPRGLRREAGRPPAIKEIRRTTAREVETPSGSCHATRTKPAQDVNFASPFAIWPATTRSHGSITPFSKASPSGPPKIFGCCPARVRRRSWTAVTTG